MLHDVLGRVLDGSLQQHWGSFGVWSTVKHHTRHFFISSAPWHPVRGASNPRSYILE